MSSFQLGRMQLPLPEESMGLPSMKVLCQCERRGMHLQEQGELGTMQRELGLEAR